MGKILTPIQSQEQSWAEKEIKVSNEIKKILDDNGVEILVSHVIKVVPKK